MRMRYICRYIRTNLNSKLVYQYITVHAVQWQKSIKTELSSFIQGGGGLAGAGLGLPFIVWLAKFKELCNSLFQVSISL